MKYINIFLAVFGFSLLLLIAILVGVQVFYRHFLNNPLSWPEEITRIAVVWLVFIGGYLAYTQNEHIGFQLIVKKFSSSIQGLFMFLSLSGILFFCVVLLIYGAGFVWKFKDQQLPYTGLSIGWFSYLPIPVFAFLTSLETVIAIKKFRFQGRNL